MYEYIAVRETPGQVSWLYGDHLGSTSVTANAHGVMTSQTLYKAWEGTGTIDGRQGSEDGGMCVSPTSIYLNFFYASSTSSALSEVSSQGRVKLPVSAC